MIVPIDNQSTAKVNVINTSGVSVLRPTSAQNPEGVNPISNQTTARLPYTDDYYKCDYSVLPNGQTDVVLLTKHKRMAGNVTVKKIPSYEVSNNYGGKTVYIGGEYNGNI